MMFGCSDEPTKNIAQPPSTPPQNNNPVSVEVFTLAPVVNAVVTDASNQLATYDKTTHRYIFASSVTYPITARANSNTFIDIDYDNNLSAVDITPSNDMFQSGIKSFCKNINQLTNLYYSSSYADNNVTTQQFKQEISDAYNIDICAFSSTIQNNAKVSFATYNYITDDNNLSQISDISSELAKVNDFFNDELYRLSDDINKTKYYSAFDSMVKLDKKQINGADRGHKPNIPSILRPSVNSVATNSNVDVFDIYTKTGSNVYVAAGQDEFAMLDSSLTTVVFSHTNVTSSFGSDLYHQNYNDKECLFLSNSNIALNAFLINDSNFTKQNDISYYLDNNGSRHNFSDLSYVSSNGYVSVGLSKRLLGISTADKGYYLINIKNNFTDCNNTTPITINDLLINENNDTAISGVFRDDGTYLYVSHKDKGITGYNTTILNANDIASSKKDFNLTNSQEAYKLKLVKNDNDLFVTTDKGVLIYDVGNAVDNLTFVSSYTTEGSQKNYYPDIDYYNDYIILTDGYKGVKIIKLDSNLQPHLCGAQYFSTLGNSSELAKVKSVKYLDGYLYLGITSLGIVKLNFNDLLFRHCR
jgi:hypothetical protein